MLAPTPDRVVITGVATLAEGSWSVVAPGPADPDTFYAQLGRRVGGRSPLSPRERAQVWLRYPFDAVPGEPPAGGSTLEVNGVEFEVCEDPGVLSVGTREVGFELKVVEVARAYPTDVVITDSTGGTTDPARIAMWVPKESHDDRGERVDEQGEASASLFSALEPRNTTVTAGSAVWRVTACVLDQDLGRVLLTLRNTRGGD